MNSSMEKFSALIKDIKGNRNIFHQCLIFNSFINNSVILVAFLLADLLELCGLASPWRPRADAA